MRLLVHTLFCLLPAAFFAQNPVPAQPKLVIGIVVDQMRYDYLYRYQADYGPNGFRRLLREGFSCENTHYNYVPTFTGPGHAAIYTGTYPAVNGIIANEWYDNEWGRHRYVTTDTTVQTVGATGRAGQHSPRVMLSTTVTDELRLSNAYRSKVVGVCLKDRGSILPAGHVASACYWFDDKSGNWITSTYYPDSLGLPQWVQDFNGRRLPDQYLTAPWNKLPGVQYDESFADWHSKGYDSGHYVSMEGGFPHDLPALRQKMGYGVLRFTPFGNSMTLDFALETIDKMQLGQGQATDFLCLSFSATDYIGHQFGIHAEETQDAYLRLDADIARLLNYLDQKFGKNNVLVFLTADHGGGETPAHLVQAQLPGGIFPESKLEDALENTLAVSLGVSGDFIEECGNQQVWLNWEAVDDLEIDPNKIALTVGDFLRAQPGVSEVWTREELFAMPPDYPFAAELRRGIHPRRSGDLLFQLEPGWHPDDKAFGTGGCTHGSSYPYDTHVPLIWYGWRIPGGESVQAVDITDIAPTLAAMLRITEPSGCTGKVITDLWRK
ncbi:MAG TPA: alkaline phosphatase family protein [Saprospiraceae bacterium]|nr:alkaline phosphatase family protein [Saprospiraceae bacterium]